MKKPPLRMSASTIKARNKKFAAMTNAQKRVAIAKDVIEQLEAGLYIPQSTYVELKDISKYSRKEQYQDLSPSIKCECCGNGSLLLSMIRFTDNATLTDVEDAPYIASDNGSIFRKLSKIFSLRTMHWIERVFENSSHAGTIAKAMGYWNDYTDDAIANQIEIHRWGGSQYARLYNIMLSIIANDGDFDPLDYPNPVVLGKQEKSVQRGVHVYDTIGNYVGEVNSLNAIGKFI